MKHKDDLAELKRVFVKQWNNYMLMTFTMTNMFKPCYSYQNKDIFTLEEKSIQAFRRISFSGLLGVILEQIKGYRED